MLATISWSTGSELSITEWAAQGRWLGTIARGSGWWLGDWIRYGRARYGDKYRPAAEATGYDVQSLMNMAYVAGRFAPERRRAELSFSHHAEVAGLTPDEQKLWLDRCQARVLSARALRKELRDARRRSAARGALDGTRRPARALGRMPPGALSSATAASESHPSSPSGGYRERGRQRAASAPVESDAAAKVCLHCGQPLPAAESD
jgi:hypothetical protein